MTNIYKVPCYIEFEVEGELAQGSLTRMAERLLSSLNHAYIDSNEISEPVQEVFETTEPDNEDKWFVPTIKQYALPKEFLKEVIELL